MPAHARVPAALPVGASVAAVGLAFLLLTGVSALSAAALVIVVIIQGAAGGYAWHRLRRGAADPAELVGVGLAAGTAAAVVAGLALKVLFDANFGWLLPAALALAHWLVVGRRRPIAVRSSWDSGRTWGVGLSIVLGVGSLLPNIRSYPLAWQGEWGGYHGDMLFFEAVATSMARLGPLDSIFSPDALIRYHWLTYAWAGQVTEAAGAAPFVTLTRVLPCVAVVGSCLIAVSWARRLSSVAWAPAFAVVLLIAGGYVGATYGAVFNFDSPSQSLTTLWLLALAVVVLHQVDAGAGSSRWHVGTLALAALLSFSLAGGKISAGAVGVAAVLWLAAVGLVRRSAWKWRSVAAGVTVTVSFAAGYALIVMGSADPGGLKLFNVLDRASSIQGMNPIPGHLGIVLGTLLLVIAIAARWSGLAWLIARGSSRWLPDTVLGGGFAIAAVATVLVLSGGMNDTWFALAASAPLCVLSAAGAAEAWRELGARRWAALGWAIVAAGVLSIVIAALWLTGPSGGTVWVGSWRWLAPIAGVGGALIIGSVIGWRLGGRRAPSAIAGAVLLLTLVSAPGRALGFGSGQMGVQPGLGEETFSPIQRFIDGIDGEFVRAWSDSEVAAAAFLRDTAGSGDLVATNVTYSPLVPALTGLQTEASGLLYQAPYGRAAFLDTLLQREAASWAFIDRPTPKTAGPLCEAGVDWLWVDPSRTDITSWAPYADVVFENSDVAVLKLAPAACQESS